MTGSFSSLAAVAVALACAKVGGEVATRLKQPSVLGELSAGLLLGHIGFRELLAANHDLGFLAELGVVLLLFRVGLESNLRDMQKSAGESGIIAALGVLFPTALCMMASKLLLPGASFVVWLFVGATMAATSVGITARVLGDLGAMQRREAKLVLGAAVFDDVLGLVLLAFVTKLAASGSRMPPVLELAKIGNAEVVLVFDLACE